MDNRELDHAVPETRERPQAGGDGVDEDDIPGLTPE